jgi:hypothetical protein
MTIAEECFTRELVSVLHILSCDPRQAKSISRFPDPLFSARN